MGETPEERAKRIADEERRSAERRQQEVDMGSDAMLMGILQERDRQDAEHQRQADARKAEDDRRRSMTRKERRQEKRDRRKSK